MWPTLYFPVSVRSHVLVVIFELEGCPQLWLLNLNYFLSRWFITKWFVYEVYLNIVFVVALLSFRIHGVPSPPDRSLQHRIDIMVLLDEIFYRLLHNIRISLQTMVSSNMSLLFILILNCEHSHQPRPTVVPLGFFSHSRSFSSCGALWFVYSFTLKAWCCSLLSYPAEDMNLWIHGNEWLESPIVSDVPRDMCHHGCQCLEAICKIHFYLGGPD